MWNIPPHNFGFQTNQPLYKHHYIMKLFKIIHTSSFACGGNMIIVYLSHFACCININLAQVVCYQII